MKNYLLIIPALLFSMLGFSQGIVFEHGTWKEVLEKAKQTNKPIFIDVYTSWCGPCKMMSRDVFTLDKVGKVYNSNFICFQIDAEKGEGIGIAKKYEIKAYPTYLFIKANGTVFYRALGAMDVNYFIALSNSALLDDLKPIADWDKEYINKKNDPTFIKNYINKRGILGLSNAVLFDEYLKLIPEEERASEAVVELYKKEGRYLKVNSLAYANLQKNSDKLFSKLFVLVNSFLFDGIMNTMIEAAKTKNEQLLTTAMLAYDQLPKNASPIFKDEIYIVYYQKTGEIDKYLAYATNFCNNQLMKISDDSIDQKDKARLQLIEKKINSGAIAKLDSSLIVKMKALIAHSERDKISLSLNNIAWEVFVKVSDMNLLQDALRWSKRSLELSPNNSKWCDTYANLLYKLGKKEEAITKEADALRYAIKDNISGSKGIEETLRKMNAGEKTWE